ncbi:MAG: hypothetical protein JWO56_267 [Acidobacteria bacterium]|nr:hypothetical protein [Acidobacteriota bacterium]
MHRAISPLFHGIIDYLLVIILAIGPGVAGFHGKQQLFCYVLAAVHFLLTVVTRFPLGAAKIVALTTHGAIELLVAILLIVLPWMASFSAGVNSRNFFVCIGVLILIVWAMTDYRNVRDRPALEPGA